MDENDEIDVELLPSGDEDDDPYHTIQSEENRGPQFSWAPYPLVYPGKQRLVAQIAALHGFVDPLVSGKMVFNVKIRAMNENECGHSDLATKLAYKYIYIINMEHETHIVRTVACKWNVLYKLHMEILRHVKTRLNLHKDEKRQRKKSERIQDHECNDNEGNDTRSPTEKFRQISRFASSSTGPGDKSKPKVKFGRSVSQDPNTNASQTSNNANRFGTLVRLTQTIRRKTRRFSSRSPSSLARFPKNPIDAHVKLEDLDQRQEQLQNYFHRIFNSTQQKTYRNLSEFKNLFGLSKFTYIKEFGSFGYEGDIEKQSGGEHHTSLFFRMTRCQFGNVWKSWTPKWFILRDSFVAYIHNKVEVRFVLLFDSKTDFELKDAKRILSIRNGHRELIVRCRDQFESEHWLSQFTFIKQNNQSGLFSPDIRYSSFVPPRPKQLARWFVCGQAYMRQVAKAIEMAKEEIFITDWWFDPEVELTRDQSERKKLKDLLIKKVDEGMKVFILVYGNVESVLPLGNYANIKLLKNNVTDSHNENIGMYTMYHPDFRAGAEDGVQQVQWAHHEKLVVIDQSTAFVGGIDLCIGRYEIHGKYPLFDNEKPYVFHGQDFFNHYEAMDWKVPASRENKWRGPWHDIACQVFGDVARDVSRHFIERWNHCKRQIKKHKTERDLPLIMPKSITSSDLDYRFNIDDSHPAQGSIVECDSIQVLRSVSSWSAGINNKEKSIYNAYRDLITSAERFLYIENQFFVSSAIDDESYQVQNKIAEYIALRIHTAHINNQEFKVYIVIPEMSGFYGRLEERTAAEQEMFFHLQMHSITRGPHSIKGRLDEFNKVFKETGNNITPIALMNYVSICSFHTWDRKPNNEQVAHESIYVHSKLAIADDRRAIIGSSNINDRSLLGDRDSEVAVIIQGEKFCASLRKQIWGVALGIPDSELLDEKPEGDTFFKTIWMKTAANNSAIYWDTFRTLPNNAVTSYLDTADRTYQTWKKDHENCNKDSIDEKLRRLEAVKGTLIMHQDQFAIKDEHIQTSKAFINQQFNTLMRQLYV